VLTEENCGCYCCCDTGELLRARVTTDELPDGGNRDLYNHHENEHRCNLRLAHLREHAIEEQHAGAHEQSLGDHQSRALSAREVHSLLEREWRIQKECNAEKTEGEWVALHPTSISEHRPDAEGDPRKERQKLNVHIILQARVRCSKCQITTRCILSQFDMKVKEVQTHLSVHKINVIYSSRKSGSLGGWI